MKTIEQVRAELIQMCGYKIVHTSPDSTCWVDKDDTAQGEEPFSTLDGIAAMMPEGWSWHVGTRTKHGDKGEVIDFACGAMTTRPDGRGARIIERSADGPTELEARTRLLHAVLTAIKEQP